MYLALERYSRPASIEECLALLAEAHDEPTALLAGGTELNVRGHEDLVHVIDLQALPLRDVRVEGDVLRVGALVTLARLRREAAFAAPLLEGLREAAAGFAVVALQNRSTLGGRVCTDRGDQDLPPVLAALGAKLRLLRPGRAGAVDEQVIDYPLGAAARRALRGALVAEVLVPLGEGRSAYRRFSRTAVDAPLCNAAVVRRPSGVRIAVNLQGPRAAHLKRLGDTESLIASWHAPGAAFPQGWREAVRLSLMTELEPWGDAWASGEYRQDVTATLVVRALARALGEEEVL
ncbi:MAG: FAD binding domain-containing protein [Planctomycetes bacterium]|nr:FAD binding domain-containing protein [Planctomycetota bacterium]